MPVTGCVDGYINDALRGNTPIRETEVGKSDSGDSGYGKPDDGRQGTLFHHQVSQKIGAVGYSQAGYEESDEGITCQRYQFGSLVKSAMSGAHRNNSRYKDKLMAALNQKTAL